jgi:hypothetical protein
VRPWWDVGLIADGDGGGLASLCVALRLGRFAVGLVHWRAGEQVRVSVANAVDSALPTR